MRTHQVGGGGLLLHGVHARCGVILVIATAHEPLFLLSLLRNLLEALVLLVLGRVDAVEPAPYQHALSADRDRVRLCDQWRRSVACSIYLQHWQAEVTMRSSK